MTWNVVTGFLATSAGWGALCLELEGSGAILGRRGERGGMAGPFLL